MLRLNFRSFLHCFPGLPDKETTEAETEAETDADNCLRISRVSRLRHNGHRSTFGTGDPSICPRARGWLPSPGSWCRRSRHGNKTCHHR